MKLQKPPLIFLLLRATTVRCDRTEYYLITNRFAAANPSGRAVRPGGANAN